MKQRSLLHAAKRVRDMRLHALWFLTLISIYSKFICFHFTSTVFLCKERRLRGNFFWKALSFSLYRITGIEKKWRPCSQATILARNFRIQSKLQTLGSHCAATELLINFILPWLFILLWVNFVFPWVYFVYFVLPLQLILFCRGGTLTFAATLVGHIIL